MITGNERQIGWFAWVMAWVGLIVGQLHALSRHATQDGKSDLELPLTAAWAEPAADLFRPLIDWGDPDLVYVTYGKIWFPVVLAFTLAAVVTYRRREAEGLERWVWRVTLAGYCIAAVGTFLDYWTQWTGNHTGDGWEATMLTVGFAVTIPGMLLMLLGSTVLGVTLLLKRFRPVLPAALLAVALPFGLGITLVTSLGNVALPVMLAFAILGRRIAHAETPTHTRVQPPASMSTLHRTRSRT